MIFFSVVTGLTELLDKEALLEATVPLIISGDGPGVGEGTGVADGEDSRGDSGEGVGSAEALGVDSSVGAGVGDIEGSGKSSSVESTVALSVAPCAKTGGI